LLGSIIVVCAVLLGDQETGAGEVAYGWASQKNQPLFLFLSQALSAGCLGPFGATPRPKEVALITFKDQLCLAVGCVMVPAPLEQTPGTNR
jgi:hypothetical protein